VFRLLVPATGYPAIADKALSLTFNMPLCLPHIEQLNAQDFLRADVKNIMNAAARGKPAPDYSRAWIKLVKFYDPEYIALQPPPEPETIH
jgi:hypothetical protein